MFREKNNIVWYQAIRLKPRRMSHAACVRFVRCVYAVRTPWINAAGMASENDSLANSRSYRTDSDDLDDNASVSSANTSSEDGHSSDYGPFRNDWLRLGFGTKHDGSKWSLHKLVPGVGPVHFALVSRTAAVQSRRYFGSLGKPWILTPFLFSLPQPAATHLVGIITIDRLNERKI